MADFASSSSSSSLNPLLFSVSAPPSSSSTNETSEEDSCSICLEPFSSDDPATITSCKHDYHLHCILEWSQRSKECPICWQSLALKDPACQELLAAVERERHSRSRNVSSVASPPIRYFLDDYDVEHESFSDDSDFDGRIMQHLAAAATRRSRYRGRERHRSSAQASSPPFVVFTSYVNMPGLEQGCTTSPDGYHNSSYGSSPTSGTPPAANTQPSFPSPVVPSVVNMSSSTDVNDGVTFEPRVLSSQPPHDHPERPSSSEMFTFPESIKSKWSAASARYKESITKSTRGIKEKLMARNTSVKELSKGVQREMSAGIAGVARMIERLDLTSKKAGGPVSVSSCDGGSSKGKGVLENMIVQSLNKNTGKVANEMSSDPTSYTHVSTPSRLEVSPTQGGH
ncbi:hypothetical protein FEM48_Zijuj07G0130000 [Ziziphus jujuba var. spinosa]|uniref:RING-type E3 ubiquitin transferase n=1 Tax=Ziziphus jujuba var. spinosa TaxID=714518 RepID=A0A978V4S6_ZIZJJ|nr:hypothetical protein FEM48_Zijuj07G0130000 [Ziziphus jujuba var. spinosa]